MKKKYILLLLLIVVAVVICCKRWSVWFGNLPEPAYDIQHHPSRVLLTMGDDSLSRYVSWQYDSVSRPCWLDYVEEGRPDTLTLSSNGTIFKSRSGCANYYAVQLKSLKSNQFYHYRIRSEKDTTQWYSFHCTNKTDYSFLFFGDVQDELDGGFDQLLPSVIQRNPDISFLLFGGDLIERPMDQYWDVVFHSLDSVRQTLPILSVAGNHEYLKGASRTLEKRFPLVFPYFQTSMNECDGNAVFAFSQGNARFFFLDSNRDFWHLPAQSQWLQRELKKSTEKWKIVVVHHPLHSVKGEFDNLMQRWAFDDIIEQYNVDLVLQGHEHVYARGYVPQRGEMNTPLRIVTYASKKDYLMEFHGNICKWGTADRYYEKISFSADTLNVQTFTSDHSLYDFVSIVKNKNGRYLYDYGDSIPEKIFVSEWFKNNKGRHVEEFENNIKKYYQQKNPINY